MLISFCVAALPNYRRIGRSPFVPLEPEVDQLIAAVGRKTATFLQLLEETETES